MNHHTLIGARLNTLSNLIKRNTPIEEADISPEVTRNQGMIIGYLSEHEGGVLQKELEAAFMLRPSTVSRTLKLMDKNGLIERIYLKDDARQKEIVLTEKARQAHLSIRHQIESVEKRLVRNITEEDLAVFLKVLDQMIDNMNV